MNLKPKLWTRDFTLLISATMLGAAGGIAGSFALSFLVYEETGSTLAAALLIAINVIPGFIVPVVAAPFMDRLPRKPFLVGGDAVVGEEPPEQLRVHAVRPVFEPRGGELRVQGVTALVIEGEGRLVAAVDESGGPGALRHVHAEPRKERRDEFGVRPLAPGLYF